MTAFAFYWSLHIQMYL